MKQFITFLDKISAEMIVEYYITQNHSLKDCLSHFDISNANFINLLRYYNIHKSKSTASELVKKSKKERFGYENYNGHENFIFEFPEAIQWQICQDYLNGSSIHELTYKYRTHKVKEFILKHNIDLRSKEENAKLKAQKISETCIKKYGVDNPAKAPETIDKIKNTWAAKTGEEMKEIKNKSWKKYFYDDSYFDSSWEIYFYIWHKYKGNTIIREPISLEYFFNNVSHSYIPDFFVNGQLYEIKSDYLFELMQIPNTIDKAKYDCMTKNNVKIMQLSDLQIIIDEVNQIYGKDYVEQFRIK